MCLEIARDVRKGDARQARGEGWGRWWSVQGGGEGHVSKEKMHVGERFSFLSSFLGGDFNLVVIQRERERELVNCLRKAITICHVYGGMFFARTINYLTIFINSPIFGKFGVNKT